MYMRLGLCFILMLLSQLVLAQTPANGETISVQADSVELNILPTTVHEGDTIAYHTMNTFTVFNKSEDYPLLEYRVRKVYPYAMIASSLLEEFHVNLDTMQNRREKRRYMNAMKASLEDEFGDELKKLSVKQGIILMKLINRESGQTSYELVKELKGNASALLWQGTAVMYGSSMKQEYDPEGEDKEIEYIVQKIENGELKEIKRRPKTARAQEALSKKQKRKAKRRAEREKRKQERKKKGS